MRNFIKMRIKEGGFFKRTLSIFMLLVLSVAPAFGAEAVLTWSENNEPDLRGYFVYYLQDPQVCGPTLPTLAKADFLEKTDVGNTTTFSKADLGEGCHVFALTAVDLDGNESALSAVSQKSVAGSDGVPPIPSQIGASKISATSTEIKWMTNELATTQIEYGLTTSYGISPTPSTSRAMMHGVSLETLTPGSTYHYRVMGEDLSGNRMVSEDRTFETLPLSASGPAISNVQITQLTSASVTISWASSELLPTEIRYWCATETACVDAVSKANDVTEFNPTYTLVDLAPDTAYSFEMVSKGASSGVDIVEMGSFHTEIASPDNLPPDNVIRFEAIGGDGEISLNWTNPGNPDYEGVLIRYRTDRFPKNINDGNLFGFILGTANKSSSTTRLGLENGVTYYFLAASYDKAGNYQTTAFAKATPSGFASPSGSSGVAGCGMINLTGGGEPPSPGQAADMLLLIGIVVFCFAKRRIAWRDRSVLSPCATG